MLKETWPYHLIYSVVTGTQQLLCCVILKKNNNKLKKFFLILVLMKLWLSGLVIVYRDSL